MIASMFTLDHRLNELRPTERDQETARWLRDAASTSRIVVRTVTSTAGQWLGSGRRSAQPSRLAAS